MDIYYLKKMLPKIHGDSETQKLLDLQSYKSLKKIVD